MKNIWRAIAQYMYKVIYVIGILVIIGITFARIIQSEPHDILAGKSAITQTTDKSSNSITNLVIKPIVESQRNQIIFEGVFWFLLWIFLFMLLPAGLLPLRRFKMFNLEFELGEREAAAIERISQNSSKALTMVNYSSDESVIRFFREFNDRGEVEYQEALEFFLQDLAIGYRDEFEINIDYKIYDKNNLPGRYRSLMKESMETREAVVLNKLENDNPLHHNWLVISDSESLVTVVTSRLTPFDAMDKYLVKFLHNFVYRIVENRNYAMALDELTIDEEDGQTG